MRSFISTAAVALAASAIVSAAPTSHSQSHGSGLVQLPLGDGFPQPSPNQLKQIEKNAFGTLSNAKPPPGFQPDTLTSLRLVAFNELFESFYFANVLKKLDDPHFMRTFGELKGIDRSTLKATIQSIVAVEELHALNANNALKNVAKVDPIKPCKYKFPVDDIKSALVLANRFTDVVMGTLQDVIQDAATVGDAGFAPGVAASAEDEGEQNGGFRLILGAPRPQSAPFLTRSVRDFAFSILQDFLESPESCPNIGDLAKDLTVFQPLSAKDPSARDQDITFTFSLKQKRAIPHGGHGVDLKKFENTYTKGNDWKKLTITYLNGLNINTVPIKSFHLNRHTGDVTVKAFFPQSENDIFGLAIAVLTVGDNFANAGAVKNATLFGPAPLEIQEGGARPY